MGLGDPVPERKVIRLKPLARGVNQALPQLKNKPTWRYRAKCFVKNTWFRLKVWGRQTTL